MIQEFSQIVLQKISTPVKRLFTEDTTEEVYKEKSPPKKVRFSFTEGHTPDFDHREETIEKRLQESKIEELCKIFEESQKAEEEELHHYILDAQDYYKIYEEQEKSRVEDDIRRIVDYYEYYSEQQSEREVVEYEEFYKIIETGAKLKEMEEQGDFIYHILRFLTLDYIKAHSLAEDFLNGEKKKDRIGKLTYNAHGIFCQKNELEIGYVLFTGRHVSKTNCRKCKNNVTWCRHIVAILLNFISNNHPVVYSDGFSIAINELYNKVVQDQSQNSLDFLRLFEKSQELYDYHPDTSFQLAIDLSSIILEKNFPFSTSVKEKVRDFWKEMCEKRWSQQQREVLQEKLLLWDEEYPNLYPSFKNFYEIVFSEKQSIDTLSYLYWKYLQDGEDSKAEEIKENIFKNISLSDAIEFSLKVSKSKLIK